MIVRSDPGEQGGGVENGVYVLAQQRFQRSESEGPRLCPGVGVLPILAIAGRGPPPRCRLRRPGRLPQRCCCIDRRHCPKVPRWLCEFPGLLPHLRTPPKVGRSFG